MSSFSAALHSFIIYISTNRRRMPVFSRLLLKTAKYADVSSLLHFVQDIWVYIGV